MHSDWLLAMQEGGYFWPGVLWFCSCLSLPNSGVHTNWKFTLKPSSPSSFMSNEDNVLISIYLILTFIFQLILNLGKEYKCYLLQFSYSIMSNSLWLHSCSTPGLPFHHQLTEFTQTHVHQVSDAIQPFHPLSPLLLPPSLLPSITVFSSQFFASGGQSTGVSASASVFPMNIQDWFLLGWTSLISLQSKGLSRVFSNTTVQKHQFFSTQLSL